MPNQITLATHFIPILDEVYRFASLTSDLDGAPELAQQGANAGELIIPKLSMDGLADYSRNSGYVDGDVELVNETVACNYDRGRKFNIDAMDNQETANLAFSRLAGEFIRTKVVPEIDAFRFATYCAIEGISVTSGTLADATETIAAIRAASTKMDEDEVPLEDRYLYITPTLKGGIDDLDTTKSREVLKKFKKIVEVPQSRFATAIKLRDGKTEGETKGGYVKADTAKDINFMIIHKAAVIQFPKHVAPKVIPPELNQNGDSWIYSYRNYGIADAYENKVAGIYLHHKA